MALKFIAKQTLVHHDDFLVEFGRCMSLLQEINAIKIYFINSYNMFLHCAYLAQRQDPLCSEHSILYSNICACVYEIIGT